MLTRLQVQGFKNLLDVAVRFGPFTCVAGPNGVGKSNLFDAIHFLHLLTQHPIMEAVRRLRESKARSPEPRSLFTSFGSFRSDEIRLTADLIIDRAVEDDFGVKAEAAISSVRYVVAFRLNRVDGLERLELVEESLDPIRLDEARRDLGLWAKPKLKKSALGGRRTRPFISTQQGDGGPEVTIHQEGHGGRRFPAPKSSVTVLGGQVTSDFPTVLAVRREMASWKTLLLEPSAMRAPASYRDPRTIDSRGDHLPAAIERLRRGEPSPGGVTAEIANRLAGLLDDVREIRVVDDERTETLTLEVRGEDGVFHPARSLSDGTLRFLVLTALSIDPEFTGLLCLEEPENGIHPARIPALVDLLRDIAVAPDFEVGPDNPLRQVVINTHAPVVIENVGRDELVHLDTKLAALDGSEGRVVHVAVPAGSWRAAGITPAHRLAPGQLRPYLRALSSREHPPQQLSLEGLALRAVNE